MKLWSSEHVFSYPWDQVAQAALRKYPNPLAPSVTGIDVIDRKVGPDGTLRTTRLLESVWSIPGWVTSLIGFRNPSYYYEYSELNPQAKELKLESRNLNCTNFISVDETLVYKPHPSNAEETLLEQSAVITIKGIPLIDHMEHLMASNINANAHNGRQGLEWVIGKIRDECDDLTSRIGQECAELTTRISTEARGMELKLEDQLRNVAIKPDAAAQGVFQPAL